MMCPAASEAALLQTEKCRKNHVCLADQSLLCPVNYRCGNHVVHVTAANTTGCGYCVRCGPANTFCTCPVRVDIYDRLNI
ncbi:MAG: hypothetical protein JRI36_05285 [Deltaproteobacteria bacterium]|nr:hypothetical protein [Deltaproteobacteria bacterium]